MQRNPYLETLKMNQMSIKPKNNQKLTHRHFTFFENNNTIHQTSNKQISKTENQKTGISLPDLIKPNAKNPGTIITYDIKEIQKYDVSKLV